MTENVFTPHTEPQAEPTLRRNLELPKGVLQKNLKTFVYLGAALLVIVAALLCVSRGSAQMGGKTADPLTPSQIDLVLGFGKRHRIYSRGRLSCAR